MNMTDMPAGFAMELSRNEHAMWRFAAMSEAERSRFIERARTVDSKEEMHRIITDIAE